MQNYVTGKGCFMSFTLGFVFQIKYFQVSLKLFKIDLHVADQKPQFHSLLFILSCAIEKEGLMTKSNTNKCSIVLVLTFLEKRSTVTLVKLMRFGIWDQTNVAFVTPTLQLFPNSFHFPKRRPFSALVFCTFCDIP